MLTLYCNLINTKRRFDMTKINLSYQQMDMITDAAFRMLAHAPSLSFNDNTLTSAQRGALETIIRRTITTAAEAEAKTVTYSREDELTISRCVQAARVGVQ
jgi:hypothetical protein